MVTAVTDSTRTTTVDRKYKWIPIDGATPRGAKLQLINRPAGVAVYGNLKTNDTFWTHWAPLPTFDGDIAYNSDPEPQQTSKGLLMPVLAILGAVLVVLKLLGYIAISWWLVLLPFYLGIVIILVFLLLGGLSVVGILGAAGLGSWWSNRR